MGRIFNHSNSSNYYEEKEKLEVKRNIVEEYTSQLKPCPFCSGKASIEDISYGSGGNYDCGWYVAIQCKSCKVRMRGRDTSWMGLENCEPQIKDVVERWNKRVE